MSTHIVIISQKNVGASLVKAAKNIYGGLPLPVTTVAVNYRVRPSTMLQKVLKMTNRLPVDTDILIMTDLYGSTPANIARSLRQHYHNQPRLVTGLNLPMLVKVLNYPELPIDSLAEKAIAGGQQGVFLCKSSDY